MPEQLKLFGEEPESKATSDEDPQEKILLAKTCLSVSAWIKENYDIDNNIDSDLIAAGLFTLAEAGVLGFTTKGEGKELSVIGIHLQSPPNING